MKPGTLTNFFEKTGSITRSSSPVQRTKEARQLNQNSPKKNTEFSKGKKNY